MKLLQRCFMSIRNCLTHNRHTNTQKLSFLPLGGKVNLKNHTHEFHLLEDYGHSPNTAPPNPLRIFFGRLIAHGQRHLIKQYSVKERTFIGNTSMDAQLSLIMANQGQACSPQNHQMCLLLQELASVNLILFATDIFKLNYCYYCILYSKKYWRCENLTDWQIRVWWT